MLGLSAGPPTPTQAKERDQVDRPQRRPLERSQARRRHANRSRTSDRLVRKRYLRTVQAHSKAMNEMADKTLFAAVQCIYMLVLSTVDSDLLHRAMAGLIADGQFSFRALLRRLRVLTPAQGAPVPPRYHPRRTAVTPSSYALVNDMFRFHQLAHTS
jgi:hypothetical protein